MRSVRRLERWLPGLAGMLRRHRAARFRSRTPLISTPWGFQFAGAVPDVRDPAEAEHVRTMERLIASSEVFVDVGANVGFFSCLARVRGAIAIAVEPFAFNADSIERNLAANRWSDVELHRCALADRAGTGTLYGRDTLASRIPGWGVRDDPWTQTVELSTLDALLGTRFADRRLSIKIDVEGAELDVLRGAARTLMRQPAPIWSVEIAFDEHHPEGVNPHFAQTFEMFFDAGYAAQTITADGPRLVGLDDVRQWVRAGRRGFGTVNYCFTSENDRERGSFTTPGHVIAS